MRARCGQSGLPPDTRIIGTVGRLNPVKDQATLLRAFARLRGDFADVSLVLVGDGASRGSLESQAAALGIGDAVRFLGDRSDVRELLQGFDVFALSSLSEGYSMALLEACASGLPIVATDGEAIARCVVDGATACWCRRPRRCAGRCLRDAVRRSPWPRPWAASGEWALREASIEDMAGRYDALYGANETSDGQPIRHPERSSGSRPVLSCPHRGRTHARMRSSRSSTT